MSLGDRIRDLREKNGQSQALLAEQMGVLVQAISLWESEHSVPDTGQIAQLGTLFGVTTDYLRTGQETSSQNTQPSTVSDTMTHGRGLSKRSFRILAFVLVPVSLVAILAVLLANHALFLSKFDKFSFYLKENGYSSLHRERTVAMFNTSFSGTEDENRAMNLIEDWMDETPHLYYYNVAPGVAEMLKGFDSDNPRLKTFIRGFENLQSGTSISKIMANPSQYEGKTVLIVGITENMDRDRRVIQVTSEGSHIECSYDLDNVLAPEKNWERYNMPFDIPVVAVGYLRRYSDSASVYLEIYNFCDRDIAKTVADWDFIRSLNGQ